MSGRQSLQFFEHLRQTGRLATVKTGDASYLAQDADGISPGSTSQRRLWEVVDLPANELADEAAHFFEHERVTLQELLQVEPRAQSRLGNCPPRPRSGNAPRRYRATARRTLADCEPNSIDFENRARRFARPTQCAYKIVA